MKSMFSILEQLNAEKKLHHFNRFAIYIFCMMFAAIITASFSQPMTSSADPIPGERLSTADNLDGNWAHATSASIQEVSTGTAPFDSDDKRGNDSSKTNDVIRSFDEASYWLRCIYDMKDDSSYSYVKNGYVGYRVVVKGWDANGLRMNLSQRNIDFNKDSLLWGSTEKGYDTNIGIEKIDGYDCVVLKAWRKLKSTKDVPTVIPGMTEVQFNIKCLQMTNGQSFQPTFYTFTDHSESNEHVSVDGKRITVSSKPKFNIEMTYSSQDSGYGTFNFAEGNDKALNKNAGKVMGRRISTGLIVEIRNDTPDKQLRGVEIPVGNITFDLTFRSLFTPKIGLGEDDPNATTGKKQDVTKLYTPLVWNLDDNHVADIRSDGRHYQTGNGGAAYPYIERIPYSSDPKGKQFVGNSTYGKAAGYSGNQDGSKVAVTIDDSYVINMIGKYSTKINQKDIETPYFPWTVSGENPLNDTEYYDPTVGIKNRAIFSCGLLSVVQPFYSNDGNHKYILDTVDNCYDGDFTTVLSDVNMRITGESGTTVDYVNDNSNQMNTDDDSLYMPVHVSEKGEYTTQHQYSVYTLKGTQENGTDNLGWSGNYLDGSDSAFAGDKVSIFTGYKVTPAVQENIAAYNQEVVKFDRTVLKPRDKDDTTGGFFDSLDYNLPDKNDGMKQLKFYYMTKPDGTNWANDNEMDTYDVDDLIAYQSLDECERNGRVCVAVGIEDTLQHSGTTYGYMLHLVATHFDILENNPFTGENNIGKVAKTCVADQLWTRSQLFDLAKNGTKAETLNDLTDDEWVTWGRNYISTKLANGSKLSARFGKSYIKPAYHRNPTYTKETYDNNGVMKGTHSGGSADGDSLLIIGEKMSVQKGIEQTGDNNGKKNVYDIDYGQRYADYVISTKMETVNNSLATNATTTVTYTDTLPKGERYIDGTLTYGGTYTENTPDHGTVSGGTQVIPTVTSNSDGTTTLKWSIPNIDVHEKLDLIHYSVAIGDQTDFANDVTNGQDLTNSISVQSTRDHRKPSYDLGNMSSSTIKVTKLRQTSLTTQILPKLNEISSSFEITSTIGNFDSGTVSQAYAATRLPWMGDGNKLSNFHGTYTIDNTGDSRVKIDASKCKKNDDIAVYVTTDKKYRTGKYEGSSGLKNVNQADIESWTPCTYNSQTGYVDIPNSVKLDSISLIGITKQHLNHNDQLQVKATLNPVGNEPGDIYGKDWSDGNNTVRDAARIVKRTLSGVAWFDSNKDGIRQSDEKLLPNINVKLIDDNNAIITDVNKNECVTTTKSDGSYSFDDLPAGSYKVVFDDKSLANYTVSPKNALIDSIYDATKDSDVTANIINGKTASAYTDNIDFPMISTMSSSIYAKEHVDAGFYLNNIPLTVSKIDQDGNAVIGAKMELYDSSEAAIDAWTTTDKPYTSKIVLTPGNTYTIVEKQSPNGYMQAEPIRFTVPNDGSVSEIAKTMHDIKIKSGNIQLTAHKTLNGKTLSAKQFTFELRRGDTGNGELLQTKQNNVDGDITFDAIDVESAGSSTYTITERNDNQAGITYDNHICIVHIQSSINEKTGNIESTITYDNGGNTFINAYAASATHVPINALKILKSDSGMRKLTKDEFTFNLYQISNGNKVLVQTAKNDENGNIHFNDMNYDAVGSYAYIMSEVNGKEKNITYDNSEKHFAVDVRDNGNGKLAATINNGAIDDLTFTNRYVPSPCNLSITAKKTIDSNDTGEQLKKNEFKFALYKTKENGTNVSGREPIETVTNDANGNIAFSTITYDRVGEYEYSIIEINDHKSGWTYDNTEYHIIVNVVDDGNGTLQMKVTTQKITENKETDINLSQIQFKNIYTCKSISIIPTVIKTLTGDETGKPNNRKFTFVLNDKNNKTIDTAMNHDDGIVNFKPITYTIPGTYTYTIKEQQDRNSDGNAKYLYDTSTKKIEIQVKNDGNGNLIATINYPDNNSNYQIRNNDKNIAINGTAVFINKVIYDVPTSDNNTSNEGNRNNNVTNDTNQASHTNEQNTISDLVQTGINIIGYFAIIIVAFGITLTIRNKRIH